VAQDNPHIKNIQPAQYRELTKKIVNRKNSSAAHVEGKKPSKTVVRGAVK
jgi:hypothetical protein